MKKAIFALCSLFLLAACSNQSEPATPEDSGPGSPTAMNEQFTQQALEQELREAALNDDGIGELAQANAISDATETVRKGRWISCEDSDVIDNNSGRSPEVKGSVTATIQSLVDDETKTFTFVDEDSVRYQKYYGVLEYYCYNNSPRAAFYRCAGEQTLIDGACYAEGDSPNISVSKTASVGLIDYKNEVSLTLDGGLNGAVKPISYRVEITNNGTVAGNATVFDKLPIHTSQVVLGPIENESIVCPLAECTGSLASPDGLRITNLHPGQTVTIDYQQVLTSEEMQPGQSTQLSNTAMLDSGLSAMARVIVNKEAELGDSPVCGADCDQPTAEIRFLNLRSNDTYPYKISANQDVIINRTLPSVVSDYIALSPETEYEFKIHDSQTSSTMFTESLGKDGKYTGVILDGDFNYPEYTFMLVPEFSPEYIPDGSAILNIVNAYNLSQYVDVYDMTDYYATGNDPKEINSMLSFGKYHYVDSRYDQIPRIIGFDTNDDNVIDHVFKDIDVEADNSQTLIFTMGKNRNAELIVLKQNSGKGYSIERKYSERRPLIRFLNLDYDTNDISIFANDQKIGDSSIFAGMVSYYEELPHNIKPEFKAVYGSVDETDGHQTYSFNSPMTITSPNRYTGIILDTKNFYEEDSFILVPESSPEYIPDGSAILNIVNAYNLSQYVDVYDMTDYYATGNDPKEINSMLSFGKYHYVDSRYDQIPRIIGFDTNDDNVIDHVFKDIDVEADNSQTLIFTMGKNRNAELIVLKQNSGKGYSIERKYSERRPLIRFLNLDYDTNDISIFANDQKIGDSSIFAGMVSYYEELPHNIKPEFKAVYGSVDETDGHQTYSFNSPMTITSPNRYTGIILDTKNFYEEDSFILVPESSPEYIPDGSAILNIVNAYNLSQYVDVYDMTDYYATGNDPKEINSMLSFGKYHYVDSRYDQIPRIIGFDTNDDNVIDHVFKDIDVEADNSQTLIFTMGKNRNAELIVLKQNSGKGYSIERKYSERRPLIRFLNLDYDTNDISIFANDQKIGDSSIFAGMVSEFDELQHGFPYKFRSAIGSPDTWEGVNAETITLESMYSPNLYTGIIFDTDFTGPGIDHVIVNQGDPGSVHPDSTRISVVNAYDESTLVTLYQDPDERAPGIPQLLFTNLLYHDSFNEELDGNKLAFSLDMNFDDQIDFMFPFMNVRNEKNLIVIVSKAELFGESVPVLNIVKTSGEVRTIYPTLQ